MVAMEQIPVFVAAEVDQSFYDRILADSRFRVVVDPVPDEQTLVETIGDAEILVTRYHNPVSRQVITAAPRLRWIVQGTSGLDNIDAAAAAERSIGIAGIPGENANAVAELVVGHMLALTRTVPAYRRMMLEGKWSRGDCASRRELRSHRIGIIGLGRVGTKVARLAAAFGCRILAYDPYITAAQASARGGELVDTLEELLKESDIVTLHVPLTEETAGMIDAAALELLPAGAIVINTCRGRVVDASAALDALGRGHLNGLAFDVYADEPPAGMKWPDDPRLILTPHIAGCSKESKESIGRLLYEKILEVSGV